MTIVRRGAEAVIYKRTTQGVRFLVIRHLLGTHAFVGGGMKRGETAEQCLRRECAEEISLAASDILSVTDLGFVSSFPAHVLFLTVDFQYHTFLVEVRNTFEPRRSLEVRGWRWLDYRAALADVSGETRRALLTRIGNGFGLGAS